MMKKLSKLKLNALNEQDLAEKQMNALRGGRYCACSCLYANSGGSSINANMNANYNTGDNGIISNGGCNCHIMYDYWYIPTVPLPYNPPLYYFA
jgi:natural product precursor